MKRHARVPVVCWIRKLRLLNYDYCISILEEHGSDERLNDAETFYIAYFRSVGCHLLNIASGGGGAPGARPSEQTRQKLAAALRGRTRPADVVERVAAAVRAVLRGKPRSPETKAKLSAALTGKVQSAATIAKRVAKLRGQRRSPEVRAKFTAAQNRPDVKEKMRAALVGRVFTPEWRAKISAAMTGRKLSPSRCAQMRESARNRPPDVYAQGWATRRAKMLPRMRFNLLGASP